MDKYLDVLMPGETYHIYNHANGTEILFKERDNYIYFLQKFIEYTSPICDVFCYCLLPNHFHFLVRIKSDDNIKDLSLSQPFSNLFNAYSKAYNKANRRKGSLFMRPFKRRRVDKDIYFTKLIHYIHANPVQHGYCKIIAEWEFSSYKSLINTKPTLLLRQDIIDWFGGIDPFIHFHHQPIKVKAEWEFEHASDQT